MTIRAIIVDDEPLARRGLELRLQDSPDIEIVRPVTILRSGVNVDAGVPIGDHCELATPGLRQAAVIDRTFDTAAFERPVRIYRGRCRA